MDHHNHHDHSGMDHSGMDHSSMDHSSMDHSGHEGHDMVAAVVNTTMKAVIDAVQNAGHMSHADHSSMDHSSMDHSSMDHSMMGHMDHSGHNMDMDNMTDGGMDHMMSMSFHFGYHEVVLFDWWMIHSIGALIGSMIGIFILAMLYEGLKYWREHLFRTALAKMQYCASVDKNNITTEENKPNRYMEQIIMPPTMNMLSLDHGIQTALHMVQMIVSYLLMLIFMTYNVWLCLAVVLGAGVGYFLFGWRKSVVVDITEHCH